jgi:hypothetical protein
MEEVKYMTRGQWFLLRFPVKVNPHNGAMSGARYSKCAKPFQCECRPRTAMGALRCTTMINKGDAYLNTGLITAQIRSRQAPTFGFPKYMRICVGCASQPITEADRWDAHRLIAAYKGQ